MNVPQKEGIPMVHKTVMHDVNSPPNFNKNYLGRNQAIGWGCIAFSFAAMSIIIE